MEESINPYTEGRPCIYRRDGAYSYAWWSSRSALQSYTGMFPVTETNPITNFVRDYDRILVIVEGRLDEDVVVTVQEVAYPGWQVFINDEPAQLESVGGQIGVVLPRSDQPYAVVFRYLPQRFLLGSIITLITALTAILYLLRVDQVLSRRFGQRLNLRPQVAVLPRSQWRERVAQILDPETQRSDDR